MVEWARPLSARDAINRHNRFSDTGRGNTVLLVLFGLGLEPHHLQALLIFVVVQLA